MKATFILILVAFLNNPFAHATCFNKPGKLVRANVLRCESALPYLKAGSDALSWRERQLPGAPPGPVVDLAAISEDGNPGTVLVVAVYWELALTSDARTGSIRADGKWGSVQEHAILWWNGQPGSCPTVEKAASLDLYVYFPCCDLVPPMGACLADLDKVEPAPKEMRRMFDKLPSPQKDR